MAKKIYSVQKSFRSSSAKINKAMNNFRGFGATLTNKLQSGQQMTNPEDGIRLTLVSKGVIDRRFLTAKSLNIDTKKLGVSLDLKAYNDFYQDLLRLEKSFAIAFYNRIIAAYNGSSRDTNLSPLANQTIRNRRWKKIDSTIPYYETGEFIRNGIMYDPVLNSVYLNPGAHSRTRGSKSARISYASIYYINEFGRMDKNIPPRPVWRPVLRALLKEYEIYIKRAYIKRFQ